VSVGGWIAYYLWPPGASYLYHQAEPLMASKHRHDWITARNTYLDPLDRRFPDHPYQAQTRAWRDQILLDEAEGRSKMLDSAVRTQLSEPGTDGERLYVSFSNLTKKDAELGDDFAAIDHWKDMARQIREDDPVERKWYLLARKRADDLKKAVEARRAFVVAQVKRIDQAARDGRYTEAATLREGLLEQYSKYADLADVLGLIAPDQSQAPPPPPGPAPPPPPAEAQAVPPP
jgi:serine/threonine-protein kinase